MLKEILKKIIKWIPIAFTKNQQYDRQTVAILKKVCKVDSNCLDVGCHKGEILDIILQIAPKGVHHGFEPIPVLYTSLVDKYNQQSNVHIHNVALSNSTGTSSFNYVSSNPAYSGLQKRKYDNPNEVDTSITVQTQLLDELLPQNNTVDFIKIDVEGGELWVLQGAIETIKKYRPIIIFECGIGGTDCYKVTPDTVFQYFDSIGYKISLMKEYLDDTKHAFSLEQFQQQFFQQHNYYFIAYP